MRWMGLLLLSVGCGAQVSEHEDPTARPVSLRIGSGLAAEVAPEFLSVALDTSQVVGGLWWSPDGRVEGQGGETPQPVFDFTRARLEVLAGALAPALLRVGGSEADRVWFETSPAASRPEGYSVTMTPSMWDGMADFARKMHFELFFTLNAGPGPRGGEGAEAWLPDNAAALVRHATEREDPVAVWELGNEVNAFQVIHGLSFKVGAEQYAEDVRAARRMLNEVGAPGRLAGPSSAYWPEIGEVPEFYPRFMPLAGAELDLITWHYYPQQSRRCPLRVRPADRALMTDPSALDEVSIWASAIEAERDAHAPAVPAWLGETGNAQCGGEPGLSDGYDSGFWWLDQLGQLARRGVPVTIRQSLTGASYGLLAEPELEPRPDYWASVLWKRTMGTRVLAVESSSRTLRAYAHCHPETGVTLVALNLDEARGARLELDGLAAAKVEAFRLTSRDGGRRVALAGRELELEGNVLPSLRGVVETLASEGPRLWLPARSFAFFHLRTHHPACDPG